MNDDFFYSSSSLLFVFLSTCMQVVRQKKDPVSGEVVDHDHVVPGLFAAGRTSCGLPRWGEGYCSGISLGDGSFFGRLAGRHVAALPVDKA